MMMLAFPDIWIHLAVLGPVVAGFLYCLSEWRVIAAVKFSAQRDDDCLDDALLEHGKCQVEGMKHVSGLIAAGADSFLMAEYRYLVIFVIVFSGLLATAAGVFASVAFVFGCITSILAGYIGMKIATYANSRTTHECWRSLTDGYDVAIRGGCIASFSLVCLGVFNLYVLIVVLRAFGGWHDADMWVALGGFSFGVSSIGLFGRVGGGIYTKAADIGADLSGKMDFGLMEDDYRNPACIADNVGDNVGGVVGKGADLFSSFASAAFAALVIAGSSSGLHCEGMDLVGGIAGDWTAMMFPLVLASSSIMVSILTKAVVGFLYKVKEVKDIEMVLKRLIVIGTAGETLLVYCLATACLPPTFAISCDFQEVTPLCCVVSIWLGLWSGLVIGHATEYYTSHKRSPVQEIVAAQRVSAASGIIFGLAVGYVSCAIPVFCLCSVVLVAETLAGPYGVALAALGMLSVMPLCLAMDAYDSIADNAGGIAEMAGLPETVRGLTDCLDAAGNTTAAIGKGFAIGSAALVSLALFGAFTVRAKVMHVDILNPWVFTGLLLGAMMPYAFAAWTMKSVGTAANDMVKECLKQFPKIMDGSAQPDYENCIRISTEASLREMLAPGALVILSPLVAGLGFGKNACAGLLSGALVSSVQLAISMSNTGGAWDNSKKYISAGGLGPEFRKGSEAHKNSVTGDTVGDPLKDTSGPALNIVMKLTAIISLVFGSAIANYSNESGGPFWL
mmetsp:Transcript_45118/g.139604  ORF Transcript_45118/g.139604 Transcript_45118/m.139604 type:complete len:732 (+) Transcript_45118:106-2301(+)